MDLPLIIEPSELQAALEKQESAQEPLLILDLGKRDTYQQAHVPGAISVAPGDIQLGTKPAPGLLPTQQQLSILFSRLGLTHDTHVVVYDDDGGPWAGRMIWVLDSIGHKNYSFLNGGIHAWLAEQRPIESQENTAAATHFEVESIDESVSITQTQLLSAIEEGSVQIWDARSLKEYTGEKAVSARGGHLPGAVSYEFSLALDSDNHLKLRDLNVIRQELAAIGINGEQSLVSHCQTHRRSGLTYVIAKALGWQMRAYDGSWAQWGNDPSMPIETGE